MSKNSFPQKISCFLFPFVLMILAFSSDVFGEQTSEFPHKCNSKNRHVDPKEVARDIENYRKGESPVIESRGELISCLEALPVLKKYLLDPDPNIRDLLTEYLGYFLFPNRLPLFLKVIETYPLENNAIRIAYNYPCRQFRRIKSKSLTNALIKRIETLENYGAGMEIYLLGCLAPRDLRAKRFLEEIRENTFTFRYKLTVNYREAQLRDIDYALAEAGDSAGEKLVLADFERIKNESVKNNEIETLEFLLGTLRGFTNCRILLPSASLILDQRAVPDNYLQKGDEKLSIGDLAVNVFATLMEKNAAGKAAIERKLRSLEERKEIYRQIQIKLRKTAACRIE
jgi:hypothetical protein